MKPEENLIHFACCIDMEWKCFSGEQEIHLRVGDAEDWHSKVYLYKQMTFTDFVYMGEG